MKIQQHTELEVYRKAFNTAMLLFEASKSFPKEETYSLTDQMRRSSRSVCANLAEAWRKRRYKALSLPSFPMLKAKPPRRKSGSSSP
jgi:23S rRNA-intervening sequence protein